jgi:hypothetical protein
VTQSGCGGVSLARASSQSVQVREPAGRFSRDEAQRGQALQEFNPKLDRAVAGS